MPVADAVTFTDFSCRLLFEPQIPTAQQFCDAEVSNIPTYVPTLGCIRARVSHFIPEPPPGSDMGASLTSDSDMQVVGRQAGRQSAQGTFVGFLTSFRYIPLRQAQ
nr:hypothetical protein B8B20.170 [imported] - Neurospora crassa [Neurospora crassa]